MESPTPWQLATRIHCQQWMNSKTLLKTYKYFQPWHSKRLLAARGTGIRQEEDCFHISLQTFSILRHAIRSKARRATVRRLEDIIMSSVKWQFLLVHLNNLEILSETPAKTRQSYSVCYQYFKTSRRESKTEKCAISTNYVVYLGHIIRPGWHEVPNHITDAILDLKLPTTRT